MSTGSEDPSASTSTLSNFDLTDPKLYAHGDPFAVWRWLRKNAPVYRHTNGDGPPFWAVTAHEPALAVYKDAATFSSRRGIFLSSYVRREPAAGKMLALSDPPRHGKLRSLINRRLAPSVVAELEPAIRDRSALLIEAALEKGTCEFVSDVAARIPLEVICDLMGVPAADRQNILDLTSEAFGADDPQRRSIAHQDILLYFEELIEFRRRSPNEDLVTVLAHGTIDGNRLTSEEILLNCNNLIVGGTENIRHSMAGGILAFTEHPDQWDKLRADPDLVGSAIEEVMRWTSPALHIMRTATRDIRLFGQDIREGDPVVIWNPSVNRDEAVFSRADEFDVKRQPNRHLSLGFGEHYCIGAALARLQLRVLIEEMARRVARIERDGPAERLESITIFGFERLPVALIRSD